MKWIIAVIALPLLAQTMVDLSRQARGASGSGGVAIQNGGQPVAARSTVDVVAGDGILTSLTDTGQKVVVQHSVDMAAIRTVQTGPRPACDVGYRGRIWLTEGGPKQADELSVCVKSAFDVWIWQRIF